MRKHFFIFLLLALPALLPLGCQQPEQAAPAAPAAFFNVSAFLQQQVKQLEQTNPPVEKTVATSTSSPETRTIRNLNWAEELGLFEQADISKPALHDSYTVSEELDKNSGVLRKTFQKRPGTNTSIQWLLLETDSSGNLLSLKTASEEKNLFFSTSKIMQLTCTPSGKGNRLSTYHIEGVQNLLFFQPKRFSVSGRIQ